MMERGSDSGIVRKHLIQKKTNREREKKREGGASRD